MVWDNGIIRDYTDEELAEMEASYQKAVEEGLITEDGESSVGGVEPEMTLIETQEVTEDEVAVVSFTNIQGYKKLHFIAKVPNGTTSCAVAGLVRLPNGTTLINGYVGNVIVASTESGYKWHHLHIEKNNGVWGGYFWASEKENQDATENVKTLISARAYENETHRGELKSYEIKTNTSGVYFPIGTTIKMMGVVE